MFNIFIIYPASYFEKWIKILQISFLYYKEYKGRKYIYSK